MAAATRQPADYPTLRARMLLAIEAAGIALVGRTACQVLFDIPRPVAGRTVFHSQRNFGCWAKLTGTRVVSTAPGQNELLSVSSE